MTRSRLFRNWWVVLIQGILMILLSVLIFRNPGVVLATLSLWFGILVLATGFYGVVGYFATSKDDRDVITLFGSIAMSIIGFMMISKLIIGMMAISLAFGALVSMIGLVLLTASWRGRKHFSMWWAIALLGLAVLIIGVKSMFDFREGAESISNLIGISVLLSGIGLIFLAFLKKKVVKAIQTRWGNLKDS